MRFSPRRSARIVGIAAFLGFEALVGWLTWLVASVRCCAAAGGAGPRTPAEWVAAIVFVAIMLLLGLVVGGAAAIAAETISRLAERIGRSRRRPVR